MRFRLQERGPITDVIPINADGKAIGNAMVGCVHGLWWPEGGIACAECLKDWRESGAHSRHGRGWVPVTYVGTETPRRWRDRHDKPHPAAEHHARVARAAHLAHGSDEGLSAVLSWLTSQAEVSPPTEAVALLDVRDKIRNHFEGTQRLCWQCSHPEEAHTVEDQGCTDPDCSCAVVPES